MDTESILQISATPQGVRKVTLACGRERDEMQRYQALLPAIDIIDRAVRNVGTGLRIRSLKPRGG